MQIKQTNKNADYIPCMKILLSQNILQRSDKRLTPRCFQNKAIIKVCQKALQELQTTVNSDFLK